MVCTSCCRGVEEFARCVFTVLSLHSTRLVRAPWPPTVSGAPHDNEVFRVKAPGLSLLLVVSVATALETHPADQGAPTFQSTVARYNQLRVGPGSIAMPGLHFVQGHLTLVLKSGNATPVLAGQETIGVFLAGTGTLEYSSTDGSELAVMVHNVNKATGLRAEARSGAVTVREEFSTALLWMTGRPAVELSGPSGPSLEAEFAGHRERFLRDASAPASH